MISDLELSAYFLLSDRTWGLVVYDCSHMAGGRVACRSLAGGQPGILGPPYASLHFHCPHLGFKPCSLSPAPSASLLLSLHSLCTTPHSSIILHTPARGIFSKSLLLVPGFPFLSGQNPLCSLQVWPLPPSQPLTGSQLQLQSFCPGAPWLLLRPLPALLPTPRPIPSSSSEFSSNVASLIPRLDQFSSHPLIALESATIK